MTVWKLKDKIKFAFPLPLCVHPVNFYINYIWKLEVRTLRGFLFLNTCTEGKGIFQAPLQYVAFHFNSSSRR